MNSKKNNRVRFYVDGLNFYYGIAKPYNFRWIDIEGLFLQLVRQIVPEAEVEKIFLFTAIVFGDAANRQRAYLNALQEHSPCVKLIKGYMQQVEKSGVRIEKTNQRKKIIRVNTYEEKATDVNLACYMVHDAHTAAGKDFDIPCLVSNDSDIACALDIQRRLNLRSLLIAPRVEASNQPVSKGLKKFVAKKDRIVTIRKSTIEEHRMPDSVGKWHIPKEWKEAPAARGALQRG